MWRATPARRVGGGYKGHKMSKDEVYRLAEEAGAKCGDFFSALEAHKDEEWSGIAYVSFILALCAISEICSDRLMKGAWAQETQAAREFKWHSGTVR